MHVLFYAGCSLLEGICFSLRCFHGPDEEMIEVVPQTGTGSQPPTLKVFASAPLQDAQVPGRVRIAYVWDIVGGQIVAALVVIETISGECPAHIPIPP